jgi:23S rRNA (adenine1618-N6)-methyltransferase
VYCEGGEYGFVHKIIKESLNLRDQIKIYSTMIGCKKNLQKILALLRENRIINITSTELMQGKTLRWAIAWSFSENLTAFKDHHIVDPTIKNEYKKQTNVLQHPIQNCNIHQANEKIMKILNFLELSCKLLKKDENSYQYELQASKNTWSNQRRRRRAEMRNEQITLDSSKIENLLMGFELSTTGHSASLIKLFYVGGNMSKDCINQILQYIKNQLAK